MNHRRDHYKQSQDAFAVLISRATNFYPPPVSFSSHRFIPSLYELWHLNHWSPRDENSSTLTETHISGCLFCYSPLRLSANTHTGDHLSGSGRTFGWKESNSSDVPLFSALERFHFIVMETQSGETSSCQGSADTQDLWWKNTDVRIKRVQTHPDPHTHLTTSKCLQTISNHNVLQQKPPSADRLIYTVMHILCVVLSHMQK